MITLKVCKVTCAFPTHTVVMLAVCFMCRRLEAEREELRQCLMQSETRVTSLTEEKRQVLNMLDGELPRYPLCTAERLIYSIYVLL